MVVTDDTLLVAWNKVQVSIYPVLVSPISMDHIDKCSEVVSWHKKGITSTGVAGGTTPSTSTVIATFRHGLVDHKRGNKLGSELDKIKELLTENGYPTDFLPSGISQKLANFAAETMFGPEKCPVYLKVPRIGNVSSKFENHIIQPLHLVSML